MKKLKNIWKKLENSGKLFVFFEIVFIAFFLLEIITEYFSLSLLLDYLVWAWLVLPVMYSEKFFEVWKVPFINIKLSIKAAQDEEKES